MKKTEVFIVTCFVLLVSCKGPVTMRGKTIDQKVDSVLQLMSLEEKIGQLNQLNDDWEATGLVTIDSTKASQVRIGQVG
jgi:beta-glucosidase